MFVDIPMCVYLCHYGDVGLSLSLWRCWLIFVTMALLVSLCYYGDACISWCVVVAGDDDIASVATNGSDMSSHQCYVSHVNSLDDSCDTADNSHLFKVRQRFLSDD